MNLNQPLQTGRIYHVYNRGINSEDLFKEKRNYSYFLTKYSKYVSSLVGTYTYCLLKNHFHLLVRIKEEAVLDEYHKKLESHTSDAGLHSSDFIVSKQFARLFSSYTQAVNKSIGRTGSLFETPFKRIEVEDNNYLTQLIWYIHFNPEKHKLVSDFRNYEYSSYHSHLSARPTKLCRSEVLSWFGGEDAYKSYHDARQEDDISLQNLIIE